MERNIAIEIFELCACIVEACKHADVGQYRFATAIHKLAWNDALDTAAERIRAAKGAPRSLEF